MPMQLLGVGKASFYGFLPPAVDFLPMLRVTVTVDSVFTILPDVAGYYFGETCRSGALGLKWA
jgi:hypothetical protein